MFKCIVTWVLAVTSALSVATKPNANNKIQHVSTLCSFEMPFYDLQPQDLTVRSKFYTSYSSSTAERKSNIALASKSLNNVFVDVGTEFSFNRTVGARTENRGYKTAKIIVGGKFVDGVGGGVCQVSTTLYNAVLLAGLEITEYHPHSLPVSYIAPSFDAMVNSGNADLRFVNNTHNPIVIKANTTDSVLTIEIIGEPMTESISRQSIITDYIPAPEEEIIVDTAGEYPDLYQGERKVLTFGKQGYKSEGFLIKSVNGKPVSVQKIRSDKYSAMRGVVIEGTAIPPEPEHPIAWQFAKTKNTL